MDKAGDLLTMVRVGDAYDHTASSGLRYIVNPPGSQVTVHQHLDIGQGEVDFEAGFEALRAIGFDCGESSTPVIPIVVGDDVKAFQMTKRLDEEGVTVSDEADPSQCA